MLLPPPCESPWLFKYIFSAISPACLMTSSFCVPDSSPFLDERSSKSCALLASRVPHQPGGSPKNLQGRAR